MGMPRLSEATIFNAARRLEAPEARRQYLRESCGDDAALLARVEALLRVHDEERSFLQSPSPGLSAVPSAPLPETAGTVLGPYRLLEPLGEGGMGTVWLAEQTEPVQRLVALKVIKAGLASAQVLARFEAERQALALMDHPNIAKVFDAGTIPGEPGAPGAGRPYFVMELVQGLPITAFCDEYRLTVRQRLGLFLPVCQAVQHAHQKGVIHRDLKPSNLLVAVYDGVPVPKVIDFGIAKAAGPRLTGETLLTELGAVVGTPEYMSPEQAELDNPDIDTRSDIYSLGVLLYELLTGTTPLDRKRLKETALLEVLRRVREEEAPTPSTRLGTTEELPSIAADRGVEPRKLSGLVRGELDWIVMKCLEKDRARRYEAVNALALDLQRYLADEPVQAGPPSAAYRFRKWARRHKLGLAATAAVTLVLLLTAAGVGWVLWDQSARRVETERAVSVALARTEQLRDQAAAMPGATSAQADAALVVWQQAADTLAQGEAALSTGVADDGLRRRVAAMRAQVERGRQQTEQVRTRVRRKEKLFHDLDEARMASSVWVGNAFDHAGASAKYAAAFAAHDLAVTPGRMDELTRRIAATEPDVRDALLVALDDWASAAQHCGSKGLAKDLRTLARGADNDLWRRRFRDAAVAGSRTRLRNLSARARQLSLPPSSLVELARSLWEAGERAEALALVRWGRSRYPTDFWLHFTLGHLLGRGTNPTPLEVEEQVGSYRAALALRPKASAVRTNLGNALAAKKQWDDAFDEYRQAIEDDPKIAPAHSGLADAWAAKKQWEKAIDEYRKAIELDPDLATVYCNLGVAFAKANRLDEAIAAFHKAIERDRKDARFYYGLGLALQNKSRLEEAAEAYRKAINLKPGFAKAHTNLGNTLRAQNRQDEAIAEYRKAIKFDRNIAQAHNGLGNALLATNRVDEAIAAYRKAIDLHPEVASFYYNLGNAYRAKGHLDEAIAAFREAVRLKKDYAEAHCRLGLALLDRGEFAAALRVLRRGHELGSGRPGWRSPSAQWVHLAERLIEMDRRLPSIVAGKDRPANDAERLALARLCQHPSRKLYAASVRFYAEAFAHDARLADDLNTRHRYHAACAAALAAAGQGVDGEPRDDAERSRLRGRALQWLRADLAAWGRLLEKPSERARADVRHTLRDWLKATELAGVRGDALARLPEAERQPWQEFWANVEQTLRKANPKDTKDTQKSPSN
jgi:eukaryotic-like serine/threonine-protein kinase